MARASYHHGDLKAALVDAAVELLREGEVAELSLRAVARRAQVSSGAPYHHFEDKPALLAEVARQGWLRLNADLGPLMAEAASGWGTEKVAEAYLRFAIDNPAHYRVMFDRDVKDADRFPDLHAESEKALFGFVGLVGHLRGQSPDEPEVMARALASWATIHGFATLWNEGMLEHKPNVPGLQLLIRETAQAAVRAALG